MLAAITTAHESIYLEMYIFSNDTTGYDFLSELERKACEGVRVIVVLDALGSFGLASSVIDRLRSAGAEVLFFSYWFRRTHRKILIIDETIAFLGGVNISKRFERWNDLQVRVSGLIVTHILRSFARVYHECGGKNPALGVKDRPALFRRARLWFIEHGVTPGRFVLRKHYEEHIDAAKRSIVLVTPYLIPHRWLTARLHQAILRGVHVEIIVPARTDYALADRINRYYLIFFHKLGASGFLSDAMNHAKIMLIDDREGTIGSHNLDALSFDWNVEAGVFFDTPSMVHDLARIVQSWKAEAMPLAPGAIKRHWYDIVFALLLRLFQPVL